jgi:hypothetical protein
MVKRGGVWDIFNTFEEFISLVRYNLFCMIFMFVFIQLSPGGILDEETIGRGLSKLGRSADGMSQVYLNCSIPVSLL